LRRGEGIAGSDLLLGVDITQQIGLASAAVADAMATKTAKSTLVPWPCSRNKTGRCPVMVLQRHSGGIVGRGIAGLGPSGTLTPVSLWVSMRGGIYFR